ncbi:hypothetical protein KVR01_006509 [Diaporthe batatas]|uniref:uncharacterized protein n=1 Tax=Diaporthe batatas TaxID=748121 RepID=UPI001D05424D|nr:uncharacterized protein KVR01_006509 [Diaporthe batatas]KAG8163212.1 hypothetical protein KVR01_006509 [Diaporthe batatas]
MGFLYVALHLHAARKGELVGHVHHPTVQQPLQASAIVVARIDLIAWAVSLIIVSVSVSKGPSPVACVNLVACASATPILIFINCVAEKASRPFDLPYITSRYSRPPSVVTCRVSDLMAAMASMPEVTSEDSISRRGSAVSLPRSHHSNNIHGSRPNSHTQHAAAIAAAHNASASGGAAAAGGGHLGGPRAPPSSVKESSASYSFNRFDDRTKRQIADSVSEASQTSEARVRIGGPRPLAASDIAVKTGVLPPPVCTEPKEVPQYPQHSQYSQQQQQQQQQHMHMHQQYQPPQQQPYQQYTTDPEKTGSETGGGGGWAKDWWALRTMAGWVSPAGSGATTPVSTPGVGPSPGPMGGNNRSRAARLSTVAEDWVPAGGVGGGSGSSDSGRGHGPYPPPARPPLTRGSRDNGYHNVQHDVNGSAGPTTPPAVASPGSRPLRAPTAARVRLVRAQEALKSQARAKSGATVVLTRPVHLTGDRREDRPAPTRPPLQSTLSIPGSYVD